MQRPDPKKVYGEFKNVLLDFIEEEYPNGISKNRSVALLIYAEALIIFNKVVNKLSKDDDSS